MPQITLQELGDIMREFQGREVPGALDTSGLDVGFQDLGYDSLSVFMTTGRIQREYGVQLDRDRIAEAGTPRSLLSLVNHTLAGAAA
ncbi:acyl carrier protein [Streptomyces sp. NBC_01218]|uniref:acyl carrier protein n=1 Tax=unclassified Streptomyces TaxID=2593676 RepID=UPI0023BA139A|nr:MULTISPECIES: acyl carrier protein [unclassified Streptomyces]WEH39061.1 acyl carrier protein [Streptomyces sp. AM 2-1-1]WSQ50717.1 acyl carrier protein [Streptomyces sp. NBC_01218]